MSDIDWCYNMLSKVSRTFEKPIKEMNGEKSDYTCVGYLLCRTADTIEDTPHISVEEKSRLLQNYKNIIRQPSNDKIDQFESDLKSKRPSDPLNEAYWNLAENTHRVLNVPQDYPPYIRNIIIDTVEEMSTGMEKFIVEHDGNIRIQDTEELVEYCYYVAGTVGHMLAKIDFNKNSPSKNIINKSENYGILLQTVNIAKDVYGDYYDENNIYIPANTLNKYDVKQDTLLDKKNVESTMKAIDDIIELSKSKIPDARSYLKHLAKKQGREHMYPWTIPYLLAIATIRELEDNARKSLTEGGVKISRTEVYNIISESKNIKADQLEELEEKIYNGNYT